MIERRSATPIGSTADIPVGTLVYVPVAPDKGPVTAPVVAVTAVRWYKSVVLWLCCAFPVLVVVDETVDFGRWDRYIHGAAIIGTAIGIAYRRWSSNTVLR